MTVPVAVYLALSLILIVLMDHVNHAMFVVLALSLILIVFKDEPDFQSHALSVDALGGALHNCRQGWAGGTDG